MDEKCQHEKSRLSERVEISPQKQGIHWAIKLFIGLLVVVALGKVFGIGSESSTVNAPSLATGGGEVVMERSDILPCIKDFLVEHKKFGDPSSVQSVPDWARGQRQRIKFTTGRDLLFYIENGSVVTVYEEKAGERKKIWGNWSGTAVYAKNVSKSGEGDIPDYTVIDAVNLLAGGKHEDVLIPSLSNDTPHEIRSKIAFAILEKDDLKSVAMYATMAAYKSDCSSSFAAQHPDAIKGRLGSISISTGEFID